MKNSIDRQTLLLNLTLIVGIIALAVMIFDDRSSTDDVVDYKSLIASKSTEDKPSVDTKYNPEEAQKKYPNFGKSPIFQAIIPPTPTPTPPPPPPEPTPDIHAALKDWTLAGVSDGVVTIENKAVKDPDMQFLDIKKTQILTLQVKDSRGNIVPRKLKIEKLSEFADNPYVIFSLEGTSDQHMIKQYDDSTQN